jgi:hypothetical protein
MALRATAALISYKLLKTKQVHAYSQFNYSPTNEVLKDNYKNLNPPPAMQFVVSSFILSITLRVIQSPGQADLERMVRQRISNFIELENHLLLKNQKDYC